MTLPWQKHLGHAVFRAAIVMLGLIGSASLAVSEERAQASVTSCVSIQTCFEDGSCTDRPYKAQLISILRFMADGSNRRMEFMINGPTVAEAGGGSFFMTDVERAVDVASPQDILDRGYGGDPQHLWIMAVRSPAPFATSDRLFHVRPAFQVVKAATGRAATEFKCGQVLF